MINSPADKILDCATLIEVTAAGSSSRATGFFFMFDVNGYAVPVLVSNRHVLESFSQMRIRIRISKEKEWEKQINSYYRGAVDIVPDECGEILHPNASIDLAILPLAGLLRQIQSQGEYIANFFVPERYVISESELQNLSAIENLVMAGCPKGLYDTANHMPLIRRGVTASHPAYHYNGQQVFLSDIACFPGSSGSPIFLYDPFGYADYKNQVYEMGSPRIKLIGIQSAGYTDPATKQFTNLAIAHNAYLLKDFKPILEKNLF